MLTGLTKLLAFADQLQCWPYMYLIAGECLHSHTEYSYGILRVIYCKVSTLYVDFLPATLMIAFMLTRLAIHANGKHSIPAGYNE